MPVYQTKRVTTTVPTTAPSPPTAFWSEVRVSAYREKLSLGPTQGAEAALEQPDDASPQQLPLKSSQGNFTRK